MSSSYSSTMGGAAVAPAITDLPPDVFATLAGLLDSGPANNWETLVCLMPEYTQLDVLQFRTKPSPSKALLANLDGRGFTIVDLARLAAKAHFQRIIDILKQYCKEEGLDVNFDPSDDGAWLSAVSCHSRTHYPPAPSPPPSRLSATLEAVQRYSPRQATPTTTPTNPLEELPYSLLDAATGGFDQLPYKEGGHKLGGGGFGEVFWCEGVRVGRLVGMGALAVKLLHNKDGEQKHMLDRAEFFTEVQALSRLSHECLLPLVAASCDGAKLCLVYPFMPQGSLDAHLSPPHTLTPSQRVGVACDIARALEYLHCHAGDVVVHRDVKSANILLTNEWRGRLGDFGIARFMPSLDTVVTTTVVGTQAYMSQEFSQGHVSPAADVYAFGVVLFELLTGHNAASVPQNSGSTDMVSFIEDFDGDCSDVLVGEWGDQGVGQGVWSLAERCIEHYKDDRPSTETVLESLEELLRKLE